MWFLLLEFLYQGLEPMGTLKNPGMWVEQGKNEANTQIDQNARYLIKS